MSAKELKKPVAVYSIVALLMITVTPFSTADSTNAAEVECFEGGICIDGAMDPKELSMLPDDEAYEMVWYWIRDGAAWLDVAHVYVITCSESPTGVCDVAVWTRGRDQDFFDAWCWYDIHDQWDGYIVIDGVEDDCSKAEFNKEVISPGLCEVSTTLYGTYISSDVYESEGRGSTFWTCPSD